MSVYTVHEPPLRAAGASAEPERFVFVRDGFYWWAFLLTPLWMLRHRLWLVLLLYIVVSAAIDGTMRALGASAVAIFIVGAVISLLAGFEGGTLRRFTLRRRGFRNVGVVSGDDLEDAERRFFDAWVHARNGARAKSAAAAAPPAGPPTLGMPEAGGVIGLFPEPGGRP